MGKIVILDDLTINQIAAGEVIERPASVVKEMVENSIDAGAKNITIEIKKGGIELIKITDDGSGISEDDMEISFERHATSKIRSSKDLQTVTTMGFRGEALASICAISRVEMVSKTANDEIGHKIIVEGGQIKEKSEIGCQKGTTITVENLFYNTPVRYKFLRKDYTEAGYIEDAVTRIALVNKNVAIKLINSGKTVIQTSGNNDTKSVIYSIYGKDVTNGIKEVNYSYEDMKITGVVGNPQIARGNRGYQLFFVNGRYVKDKTLTSSADNAYKDILPVNKYGFLILNIQMDPRKVDVNVHPAKLEVRFEDESLIYKAVYHAIKSGLEDVKPAIIHETEDVKTDVKTELEDSKTIEKIQEKEFSIEEKKNFEPKFELEEDIVQPKMRTGFTDLLKKVIRNGDSKREEFIQDNVVEAIFEERKGKKRATPDFEEFDNDEEIEKKQNKIDLEKKEDEKRTIYNSNFKFIKETYDDENMVPKKEFEESDIIFNKKIKENDLEKNNDNTKESEDKNVEKIEQNKNPEEIIKKENNIIEDVNEENESSPEKSIKFGNVSIVSETSSATMNFEEFIKEEKRLEETEVINEDFKEISKEEKIEDITKKEESINENKNSTSEIDELTEFIVKNKIDNSIEPTQILDTNKIRDKLPNIEKNDTSDVSPEFAEMYKKTFGKDITKKSEEKDNIVETYNDFLYSNTNENLNVFDREDDYIPERKYRFIGIVFDSFLIIEINNEMYIIDQRLAYERIIYDRIKDNYYNEEKKDSQILLLPDIISLNKKQIAIANENIEMFERAGFGFEEFGANTLKLYAVPGLCEKLNTKQLFIDILDSLDSVSIISKEEKEEKFISTISHKSAIKSKLNLEERELIQVLNELLSLKEPFICADNKQIAIKMTKVDFERKFSRR